MKRIVIWNKHEDEAQRLRSYLEAGGYEVQEVCELACPSLGSAHCMFMCEGVCKDSTPPDVRKHTIIYLCGTYSADQMGLWASQGFRAYLPKEQTAYDRCPGSLKAIVPPFIRNPNEQITDGTGGICGMVVNLDKRNPAQYHWALQAGITIYGTDTPFMDDLQVLRHLRWLWHTKTIGYVCNAVIKALVSGVPVLTNPETVVCGYEKILKDGENCLIRRTPAELKSAALATSEEEWARMSRNCWASRELYCKIQPKSVEDLVALVEAVAKKER